MTQPPEQPPWGQGPPPPPPYHPYAPPYPAGPPPRGNRGLVVALAVVAAVVVLAAAVVVPVLLLADRDDETPTGPGSAQPAADLAEVEEYDDLPTTHVTDPVDYPQTPPVGGAHFGEWLDCGVYDAPVPDEAAVHDLEHGAVWITHDPSLPAEDVDALAAQLPRNGIMSPYDGLPAPVVVTVWGRQLALTGADDPRLGLFVREFQDGDTAPEPFASCAGGTADPTVGTPA